MEMNVNFRKERFSHTAKPKLNYVNSQVTDALSKSCGYSCQQPSCFSESLCPQDSWFQTVQIQLLFIFAFISWNNLLCKHCQSSPHTGYRISNIQQLSRCANASDLVRELLETLTAHHKTIKPLRVLFLLLFVCIWVWLWMNIHSMRGYPGGQKMASGPLKLTLETIVSFTAWVLGTKFQCSARAVCESPLQSQWHIVYLSVFSNKRQILEDKQVFYVYLSRYFLFEDILDFNI